MHVIHLLKTVNTPPIKYLDPRLTVRGLGTLCEKRRIKASIALFKTAQQPSSPCCLAACARGRAWASAEPGG